MVDIREMTAADYDKVFELWKNTPGIGLSSVDDSREGIEKYLKRNPGTSFVALIDGKIVGSIMAGHDGRRGYIYHTAVLNEFRGRGIASKLVACAMEAIEKEGINKVALVAFAGNEPGNCFWESIGFEAREDLVYRNKNIRELNKTDT